MKPCRGLPWKGFDPGSTNVHQVKKINNLKVPARAFFTTPTIKGPVAQPGNLLTADGAIEHCTFNAVVASSNLVRPITIRNGQFIPLNEVK